MVASANISDKSVHPQEGSKKQNGPSSPFSPTSPHKFGHNSTILGSIEKWFAPSCSLRDSASNISIYRLSIFFKMADDTNSVFDINNI